MPVPLLLLSGRYPLLYPRPFNRECKRADSRPSWGAVLRTARRLPYRGQPTPALRATPPRRGRENIPSWEGCRVSGGVGCPQTVRDNSEALSGGTRVLDYEPSPPSFGRKRDPQGLNCSPLGGRSAGSSRAGGTTVVVSAIMPALLLGGRTSDPKLSGPLGQTLPDIMHYF